MENSEIVAKYRKLWRAVIDQFIYDYCGINCTDRPGDIEAHKQAKIYMNKHKDSFDFICNLADVQKREVMNEITRKQVKIQANKNRKILKQLSTRDGERNK